MVFADKLYLSPDMDAEYKRHIKALKLDKPSFLLYIIVFLENDKEICLMHNALFLSNYKDSKAFIVGLALGKREGIKLLARILEDTYNKRKDFDCYGFFKSFKELEER